MVETWFEVQRTENSFLFSLKDLDLPEPEERRGGGVEVDFLTFFFFFLPFSFFFFFYLGAIDPYFCKEKKTITEE